jgi:hypothetical protein
MSIQAFEAKLIAQSADPNHTKSRFLASVMQFNDGSALNDWWGMFQPRAAAADVVGKNGLLKAMAGVIDSGQLHPEPNLMAWIDAASHTLTSVTLYPVQL